MSRTPTVKGSKQLKMVVVPHQPLKKALVRFGIVLLMALVGSGAYFYGHYRGVLVNGDAMQQRDQLLLQVDDMSIEMGILQQELINAQQAGAVDRQALEEVQATILNLRETIAQLQEDVLFYKQIMSPDSAESGMSIGQLDLISTDEERRFRYRLELRQVGNNENLINGYANVNILGSQDRQEVSLPLRGLSVNEDQLDIKLQLRYFQNIQGEMVLPEGFSPTGVQILAVDQSNDDKTVQKSFAWLVE